MCKKWSSDLDAQQYCHEVEREDRRRKQLFATVSIHEDQSPLISLRDAGFRLMFEPSMVRDYDYRVREAVCAKIGRISQRLVEQDKLLIIRSAWRSFEHQTRLWEEKVAVMRRDYSLRHEDEIHEIVSRFVAPPKESMHATGGAVDALIHDVATDRVLNFGNNEGLKLELNETCYPYHPGISAEARQNRQLIMGLFEEEGFIVDCMEYWHFDYENVSWAAGSGRKIAHFGVIEEVAG
jgi:D-alanyl-D-alanine dipeptidase